MTDFTRRTLVKTSLAGLTLAGLASGTAPAHAAIPLVRKRLTLPTGIATGDVTPTPPSSGPAPPAQAV